ncbi:hypothetical protein BCV70DRAFT_183924 [Testicularia cyperi]|uniref:Origin recognition complex subunit 5 n=1 Tax=Testicularia cyperi TaxID=1882483 RepID=A0A317XZ17_9BASI|nr:hypothetical protein BCV70DRAFT_183924 [Testicularia cyperi]
MAAIGRAHPGRLEQIESLIALLGQPNQPVPSSVVLHDACSPATTTRLVRDLLAFLARDNADGRTASPLFWTSVSPLTSINPTTVFRNILGAFEQQLHNHPFASSASKDAASASNSKRKRKPDTSIDYFIWKLSTLVESTEGNFVIAISDAERIRDLWPEHVWTSFCRLGSLLHSQGRVCVAFISTLPWSQYRTPSGLTVAYQPLSIRFPRLTRPDILSILSLDFPGLWRSYEASTGSAQIQAATSPGLCSRSIAAKLRTAASGEKVSQEALRQLYEQFSGLFYDSIRSNVRDLEELRTMSAAVWHSFVVPVQTRECSTHDLQTLLLAASSLFRDVVVRLQTREVGPREWTLESRAKSIEASKTRLAAAAKLLKNGSTSTMEASAAESLDIDMVDEEQKLDEEEWLERETRALDKLRSASSQASISLTPSLALIPTFLVLASFLASYNPSRLDVRYFLRDESLLGLSSGASKGRSLKGGRKLGPGRGRKGGAAGKGAGRRGRPSKSALRVTTEDGQTENLNRQQLLGPRPFPIDRLLSVFQALVTESAPEMSMVSGGIPPNARSSVWEYRSKSLSVYSQINNLVARRMLVRTSAQDKLGTSINFRTNVGYNVASVLARRVKFDLDEWLWDWGAGGGNAS